MRALEQVITERDDLVGDRLEETGARFRFHPAVNLESVVGVTQCLIHKRFIGLVELRDEALSRHRADQVKGSASFACRLSSDETLTMKLHAVTWPTLRL
jgi:hypothetical protein